MNNLIIFFSWYLLPRGMLIKQKLSWYIDKLNLKKNSRFKETILANVTYIFQITKNINVFFYFFYCIQLLSVSSQIGNLEKLLSQWFSTSFLIWISYAKEHRRVLSCQFVSAEKQFNLNECLDMTSIWSTKYLKILIFFVHRSLIRNKTQTAMFITAVCVLLFLIN